MKALRFAQKANQQSPLNLCSSAGLFSERLSEARSVLLIRYPPRVPCTSRVFLLQFWKEHFGGAYPLLDL